MLFFKSQIIFYYYFISHIRSNMPPGIFVCHLSFFRNWVDGRDHFKNDFKKSRIDLGAKSVYGPNREMTQNVGTKSVFTPFFFLRITVDFFFGRKRTQWLGIWEYRIIDYKNVDLRFFRKLQKRLQGAWKHLKLINDNSLISNFLMIKIYYYK